jgi:hypothetical protein
MDGTNPLGVYYIGYVLELIDTELGSKDACEFVTGMNNNLARHAVVPKSTICYYYIAKST